VNLLVVHVHDHDVVAVRHREQPFEVSAQISKVSPWEFFRFFQWVGIDLFAVYQVLKVSLQVYCLAGIFYGNIRPA
jgi:hypothetical protein